MPGIIAGYSYFSGWKANIDFSGNTYTSIAPGTTGDRTFYAAMTTIEYTLNFYLNGSLYSTQKYNIFDSVTFITPLLYTDFSGWHLGSMTGTLFTALPRFTYGDYNFYATGTYNSPIIDYPVPLPHPYPYNPPPDIIIVPPPVNPPIDIMSTSIEANSSNGISKR